MNSGHVTTPFGRRSMTLGMLATQVLSRDRDPAKPVDKWKLFRALCEARPLLGITDRALAVMNALLSFYPKNELTEESNLVVFPSNAQLSLRSHGMAEQTIRRHLTALVEAGLLLRRDSPNGKRYARRGRQGEVSEAFGFSLSPLLSRTREIEQLAAQVVADRLYCQRLRERITICRRDITKLIEAGSSNQLYGDWTAIHATFRSVIDSVPRKPSANELEALLQTITAIRENILKQLEEQIKTRQESGNPSQNERHIQSSDTESYTESERANRKECATDDHQTATSSAQEITEGSPVPACRSQPANPQGTSTEPRDTGNLRTFPLGMVLQACPDVSDYGPGGQINTWRDMMSAAIVVRSMLGVSPSAYEEAASAMGPENAAAVMAYILERGGRINSAGGYLRNLTRRTQKGEFAVGPMLMSLLRSNGKIVQKTG